MAVEKTEAEKIAMCRAFLEKRGFFVGERYMGADEVAELLAVSSRQVFCLDIPALNVARFGGDRKSRRYAPADVRAWIEKKKEAA
jgi:hypothetical protein